jgi:predicted nucleotide-binding protein
VNNQLNLVEIIRDTRAEIARGEQAIAEHGPSVALELSLASLRYRLEELEQQHAEATKARKINAGKKVFLVHGSDDSARYETARFLEKLHLDPIVLHEQPQAGRNLVSKFLEENSDNAVAVVLLTPDDVGAIGDKPHELKPRPRQNVIFELGYFLGRLGLTSVVVLVKGKIETPSDLDGVLHIELDEAGTWKLQLAKGMKAAGFNVDLNDAIRKPNRLAE